MSDLGKPATPFGYDGDDIGPRPEREPPELEPLEVLIDARLLAAFRRTARLAKRPVDDVIEQLIRIYMTEDGDT